MNPWIGDAVYFVGLFASIIIRIPHDKVSRATAIVETRKGILENVLLFLVAAGGFILPTLSLTPILKWADHSSTPFACVVGCISLLSSLLLFQRSHLDLGRNWSPSLELRENHRLIVGGVYKSIRHPMYASIFLLAFAQALLISNWIAGPGLLITFSLMFGFRVKKEEGMMEAQFGSAYRTYRSQTKRLIPEIW